MIQMSYILAVSQRDSVERQVNEAMSAQGRGWSWRPSWRRRR
jgi:hypothetical protein